MVLDFLVAGACKEALSYFGIRLHSMQQNFLNVGLRWVLGISVFCC